MALMALAGGLAKGVAKNIVKKPKVNTKKFFDDVKETKEKSADSKPAGALVPSPGGSIVKVVDVKVDFYDGKMHPVDSKDIAFQTAGKHAFREAFLGAQPCLLEPIMDIEVKVPEDYMGDIMGDISGKRGKIMGMDADGSFQVIKAQVPQAELYHYATTVRSLTGGRGIHSESFSHYEKMPKDIEKKVAQERQKQEDE